MDLFCFSSSRFSSSDEKDAPPEKEDYASVSIEQKDGLFSYSRLLGKATANL
jgi:hypothetical protein